MNIATHNAALIHIGENTQIQLQLITPQSFNTMNTIVSRPENPIPPETVVLLFDELFDI